MTTAPDITNAKDRAARELARRLQHIVPTSLLADPLAFANQYLDDLITEHWRPIPPGPNWKHTTQGQPPNDTYLATKAALTQKDDTAP